MRTAKVEDYWKKVFKRKYDYSIENVNLNGVGGIEKVEFEKGIFAICGLNGAGKSTIISSLKDILGLKINNHDLKKVNGTSLEAQINIKGEQLNVQNQDMLRSIDKGIHENSIYYLDYKQATDALDFLSQDNLDELLDQYEKNIFSMDLIKDLNYIVGKEYQEVVLIEIEDEDQLIPYFQVKAHNLEYNSLAMGIGEHFLFYIFWLFYRMKESGIILIEEPETFISVNSQRKLMNFIAKKSGELGVTVIIATHSPHIIRNIRKENIMIISRYFNHVSITKPLINKESLISLGLEIPKEGCIFVEDYVAELFLKILISKNCDYISRDYNIENVKGHAGITERLKFPKSEKFTYNIIGIYDGDMKEQVEKIKEGTIKWSYSFLPTKDAIEVEFMKCIESNVERFSKDIDVDISKVVHILASIDGEDHHDWLIELARKLGIEVSLLVNKLYHIWIENTENRDAVKEFIQEIESFVSQSIRITY